MKKNCDIDRDYLIGINEEGDPVYGKICEIENDTRPLSVPTITVTNIVFESPYPNILAYATVGINGHGVFNGFSVGRNRTTGGLFVNLPSTKINQDFVDVLEFENDELVKAIKDKILSEFKKRQKL